MKSLFEENGGTYTTVGDYLIPDIIVPEESDYSPGIWAIRHLAYLKRYRRVMYVNLLTSSKLTDHLREVDTVAQEMWDNLIRKMAKSQGITEQLKVENQLAWVGRMNNIRTNAKEIVFRKIINQ